MLSVEAERKVKPVATVADMVTPLRNENHSRLQVVVMTEALKLPYSVQGRGTVESIGNHFYRVCGPAGCTVVMGLSNALYLSRNVPESASPADP